MTTYAMGDRVLVRDTPTRGEREAEVIEDRGNSVRVVFDDGTPRTTIRKDRVRHVPEKVVPKRVTPMRPPGVSSLVSAAARVEVADAVLRAGVEATSSVQAGAYTAIVGGTEPTKEESAYIAASLKSVYDSRAVPKPPKPMRDAAFLAFVREQRCMSCHIGGPSEAHHFGPRGMSQKCDDYLASPLCTKCHRYFHDHGTLPSSTREETERAFAHSHAMQLSRWVGQDIRDPLIRDALIAHLRSKGTP